jgi:hypothetical protein
MGRTAQRQVVTGRQAVTGKQAFAGKAVGKQAGLAGKQTGIGKGQQSFNKASKMSGLSKGNINKGNLGKAQSAAKNKFANNPKLAGMNKQNAKNLLGKHNWHHFHNGIFGWNPLWWGLGFGLLPFAWLWGWNWWWGNGIWWWAGYPWWWWYDYDPDYFEDVVYPQYVAQYEGVSGDDIANYWDITNATNNRITVNAKRGESNVQIESGATKRVFHDPGVNSFSADTDTGTINFDNPEKEVTVETAEKG